MNILNQMAKINKKPLLDKIDMDNLEFKKANTTILDLFNTKEALKVTLSCTFLKFVMIFVLYSMALSLPDVGYNLYVNAVLIVKFIYLVISLNDNFLGIAFFFE